MHTQVAQRQQQAMQSAQKYTFLDFCSMFEADSFDEEVMLHGRWMGLTRDESGLLQVYAEFVFDDAACTNDSEALGTGWWL